MDSSIFYMGHVGVSEMDSSIFYMGHVNSLQIWGLVNDQLSLKAWQAV